MYSNTSVPYWRNSSRSRTNNDGFRRFLGVFVEDSRHNLVASLLRDEAWTEDELKSLQAIRPQTVVWTVAIGLIGAFAFMCLAVIPVKTLAGSGSERSMGWCQSQFAALGGNDRRSTLWRRT